MMRKLYLMMDNWNENKPFVLSEIEEIRKHFDLSIICNDTSDLKPEDIPEGIAYYTYAKKKSFRIILYVVKFLMERDVLDEIRNIKREGRNVQEKITEILRFYINAELYYEFLKKEKLISKDSSAIYYSYWYFWKCFALTKHRKDYPEIKIITRAHGYDLYKNQIPSGYQPFKKAMDRNLDKVIFISEHGQDYYEKELGIKKTEKHCLCKLGTKDVDALYIDTVRIKEELNKPNRVFRIVSCSSVVELKRVNLIVEALALIDDVKVEWTHFGGGPLYEELKVLAKKLLGNKNNITYLLPGKVSNQEIMDYYSNNYIDVFMMMSRSEGNPVSVIEAMSCGIPIISTSINNMPNLIKGNGILIDENPTKNEIVKAIMKVNNLFEKDVIDMHICSRRIWEMEYRAVNNDRAFVMNDLVIL